MDEPPAPPAYLDPNEAPPTYTPPTTFTINNKAAPTFITTDQLKGHLSLLRLFSELRERITGETYKLDWAKNVDPERRWDLFVGLAAERYVVIISWVEQVSDGHRFERWCKTGYQSPPQTIMSEEDLPPVDAIMVWHAYMLNPGYVCTFTQNSLCSSILNLANRWYSEDAHRFPKNHNLSAVDSIFSGSSLATLAERITAKPSEARLDNWYMRTMSPFDIMDSPERYARRNVRCPGCRRIVSTGKHPSASVYLSN